jgi:hypothetical protein
MITALLAAVPAVGTAVPAVAAVPGDQSAVTGDRAAHVPPPPTPESRAAAREVKSYLDSTPKPVEPAVEATDEHEAYEQAALAWLNGFPARAGLVQWGCELQDLRFWLVPSSDGGADSINAEWVISCPSGYFPGYGDFFVARADALDGTGSTAPVESSGPVPGGCVVIHDGAHCFDYTKNPLTGETLWGPAYIWVGSGTIAGRFRVGSVPPVWPACSEGSIIATSSVRTLETNTGAGVHSTSRPAR